MDRFYVKLYQFLSFPGMREGQAIVNALSHCDRKDLADLILDYYPELWETDSAPPEAYEFVVENW